MTFSDEILMAYVDGELDDKTRVQVESALNADPEVARRVASHRARRESRTPARVIPIRPRNVSPRSWPTWSALAASFVIGALVLRVGTNLRPSEPITTRNGQLLASGALEQALTNQLASDPAAQAAVRIGVSFRSKSGEYCRTFELRDENALAGLACRGDQTWKVAVLAQTATPDASRPEFRPAISSLPPFIVEAVKQTIVGDPLDAKTEGDARANRWRVPP